MIQRIFIFLLINFAALAIGGLYTNDGVTSEWYMGLTKAPWTPPGWVFGFAWTLIMVCLSVFMAFVWTEGKSKTLVIVLFTIQWILNVAWNPVFFKFHDTGTALIIIGSLTTLMGYFIFEYVPLLRHKALLLLPYFLWLLIATSLNLFIWQMN